MSIFKYFFSKKENIAFGHKNTYGTCKFLIRKIAKIIHVFLHFSHHSLAGLENLSEYSFMLAGKPVTQAKTSNVAKVLGGVHKIKMVSLARYSLKVKF